MYSAALRCSGLPVSRPFIVSFARNVTCDHQRSAGCCARDVATRHQDGEQDRAHDADYASAFDRRQSRRATACCGATLRLRPAGESPRERGRPARARRVIDGSALAAVAIGSCTISVTSPGHVVSSPFFITWRLPTTEIGTIGRPACIASIEAAALELAEQPVAAARAFRKHDQRQARSPSGALAQPKMPRAIRACCDRPACGRCAAGAGPSNGKLPSDSLAMMRS